MRPNTMFSRHPYAVYAIGLILLLLVGCGTPEAPAIVSSPQPTALPPTPDEVASPAVSTLATEFTATVLPASGATTTISTVPASATTSDMAGMAMPTTIPASTIEAAMVTATPGPSPTDFVIDWILFGTPTTTPVRVGVQPTDNAVTWVPSPTLPATATRIVTAIQAAGPSSANSGANGSAGDPVRGKAVFTGAGTCFACHDTSTGNTIVGPSLKGVASRAGTRKPGMSAEAYLRESILTPNAYIVPGFPPSLMPQTFSQTLSSQQIDDVIAYLLTLK